MSWNENGQAGFHELYLLREFGFKRGRRWTSKRVLSVCSTCVLTETNQSRWPGPNATSPPTASLPSSRCYLQSHVSVKTLTGRTTKAGMEHSPYIEPILKSVWDALARKPRSQRLAYVFEVCQSTWRKQDLSLAASITHQPPLLHWQVCCWTRCQQRTRKVHRTQTNVM